MDRKKQNNYLVGVVKQADLERQARRESARRHAEASARLTHCFSDEAWDEVEKEIANCQAKRGETSFT